MQEKTEADLEAQEKTKGINADITAARIAYENTVSADSANTVSAMNKVAKAANAPDPGAEGESAGEKKARKFREDMLTVQGFRFSALADAKTAEEEYKKMVYIKKRMNKDNPEEILAIYDKMIENGLFVTPVGVDFLMRVREYLVDSKAIDPARIRPIETGSLFTQRARNEARAAARPRVTTDLVEENRMLKRKYRIAVALAIIAICLVGVMFVIAKTSSNPNIINYKNAIENQYSEWEQSLEKREQELKQKEAELNGQD